MASITFVNKVTVITTEWLNEVNDLVHNIFNPSTGDLTFSATEAPLIRNVGGVIADPAFCPDKNFNQSGIGTGGSGYVSVIVNGSEKTEWLDNGLMSHFGGDIVVNTANAKIYGSQGDAAALLNEIASGTNPTLVPNRTNITTGLGSKGSGRLSLIGNGVEFISINSDGSVTIPLQPAFHAFPSSAQSNVATGSDITIAFGSEVFDIGGDFASNTFTAPQTGKYQFNALVRLVDVDTAATSYLIKLITSNKTYVNKLVPLLTADHDASIVVSILVDMDASDTAYLAINQSGGTAQTDIPTTSNFNGFLVA